MSLPMGVSTATAMNAELSAADPILLNNDALLAAVLGGSGDCIKILDLEGRLQFMSDGGKRVMEVDDFSQLKGCPWPDFWAGAGNEAARHAVDEAKAGRIARFIGAADTAKGTPKFWDVQVMPIPGPDGKPTHLLSISRDISELKFADDQIVKLRDDARDAAARDAQHLRRLLKNAPGFMCVLRGPAHIYEIANDAYLQIIGHRSVIGKSAQEAHPEAHGLGFREALDCVYATGEPVVANGVELQLQRDPDGPYERAFLDFIYQPITDDAGVVTGIFVEGNDVTGLKNTELALRQVELQAKVALSAARMGVWQCDIVKGIPSDLLGDERALELLGAKEGDPTSFEAFLSRLHPDDRESITLAAVRAIGPGGDGAMNVEYRVLGSGVSTERWIHARAQAVTIGNVTRLIGTVRDISESKQAELRQETLRDELQHRIKNTFAMVNAIAMQTLRGPDIAERRNAFAARINAFARAQDVVVSATTEDTSLHALLDTALAPHRSEFHTFEIDGPAVALTAKQAVSMALTVHELATNAAKYGALSVMGGKVGISWSLGSREGRQEFRFVWREENGPSVTVPTTRGFGSRMIEKVLASDFGGQVRIEYEPGGVVCTLVSTSDSVQIGLGSSAPSSTSEK